MSFDDSVLYGFIIEHCVFHSNRRKRGERLGLGGVLDSFLDSLLGVLKSGMSPP